MRKAEFTKRIAKQSKLTPAAAADQLDRLVEDILERLKKGQRASLPGLGTFAPGGKLGFEFEKPQSDPKTRRRG